MKSKNVMILVKVSLTVAVIGTIIFFICKWNVSLEPPQKPKAAIEQTN